MSLSCSAAAVAALPAFAGFGKSSFQVLMYHELSEDPNSAGAFCITPETFAADLRYLQEQGYTFCFASQADDVLSGRMPAGKYVCITFDDGYESDACLALPLLEQYGAKATFFVIAANVDTPGYLSRSQLVRLAQSPSAQVGSHSYGLHKKTVAELRYLFGSGQTAAITEDFQKGAAQLQEITGQQVTVLSYPNGIWNQAADRALRTAGFTATFTSEETRNMLPNVPCGRINRFSGAAIQDLLKR